MDKAIDKPIIQDIYDILRLIAQGDTRAAGKLLKNEFYLKYLASDEEKQKIDEENAEIAAALAPQEDAAPAEEASEEVVAEETATDEGEKAEEAHEEGQASGSTVPEPEQTGDKNEEEQPAPGSVNAVGN